MTQTVQNRWRENFRRLVASSCAALVFALGLFAASPALHEQLHHAAHAPASDTGCAITLFAVGVSVPVALQAEPPVAMEWRPQPFVRSSEVSLDSPRFLLQPGRGPPLV